MASKIIDNSAEIKRMMSAALEQGLEACGIQGESYAKTLAPVDTGRLRNSITHAVDGDTAYIGTNVEYAVYQEMGTSKMPAHPYLKPAVQNHIAEYNRILNDTMENA